MKKLFFSLLTAAGLLFCTNNAGAQVKIGVFDLDAMVTAMPAYRVVDSLLNQYQTDSLANEYDYYVSEYKRLDSTLKFIDTPGVKTGAVNATKLDLDNKQKQQLLSVLVNWRDVAQRRLEAKKGQLSQGLYDIVAASYEKILKAKNYALVLKPGAYEYGTRIENIFISVARDLKLAGLPQQLVVVGIDPDAPAQGQVPAATTGAKPAGTKPASH